MAYNDFYFTQENMKEKYTYPQYRDYLEELTKGPLSELHSAHLKRRKEILAADPGIDERECDRRLQRFWCEKLLPDSDQDAGAETPTDRKRKLIDYIAYNRIGTTVSGEHETAAKFVVKGYDGSLRFIEEFLQNADDCSYASDTPAVSIVVEKERSRIAFSYNEAGFGCTDVLALTAVEQSLKQDTVLENKNAEGVFYLEKTGRKGLGFKAVFSLQEYMQADNVIVHIQSNGYSFRFDGKISIMAPIWEVPIWEDDQNTHIRIDLVNPKKSWDTIYSEMKEFFCIDKQEKLFARCPLLFMHQLRRVCVENRAENKKTEAFAIEYREEETVYSKDAEKFEISGAEKQNIKSGIYDPAAGKYCLWQTQKGSLLIHSSKSRDPVSIRVFRYTRMHREESGLYRNYSVAAPILTDEDILQDESGGQEVRFRTGGLFSTFPITEHTYSIPIAMDAFFELNDTRSELDYGNAGNEEVIGSLLGSGSLQPEDEEAFLLADFLTRLAGSVPEIRMDLYLWYAAEHTDLFDNDNNNNMPQRNLFDIVKTVPLLHPYMEGAPLIACDDALILPKECYAWEHPELLAYCCKYGTETEDTEFDPDELKLVRESYHALLTKRLELREEKLSDASAVNTYLELLDGKEFMPEEYRVKLPLKKWMIFLPRLYRYEWEKQCAKQLKIFGFMVHKKAGEDYQDCFVRESAADIKNDSSYLFTEKETAGQDERKEETKYGIARFRLISQSSLKKIEWHMDDDGKWAAWKQGAAWEAWADFGWPVPEPPALEELFSETDASEKREERQKYMKADTWEEAKSLIEACLYYGKTAEIPYLWGCVLHEDYDQEKHICRDGYYALIEQGKDASDLLKHIITQEDLIEINKAAAYLTLQETADRIKAMGTLASSAVWKRGTNQLHADIYRCIDAYCTDRKKAEDMLGAVCSIVAKRMEKDPDKKLEIEPDMLEDCHPAVFAVLLRDFAGSGDRALLSAPQELARRACEIYTDAYEADGSPAGTAAFDRNTAWQDDDGKEAFIRAFPNARKFTYKKELVVPIDLKFIKRHRLFDAVNRCVKRIKDKDGNITITIALSDSEKAEDCEKSFIKETADIAEDRRIENITFKQLKLGGGEGIFLFDLSAGTLYLNSAAPEKSRDHFVEIFYGTESRAIRKRMELLKMQRDKADKKSYIKALADYRRSRNVEDALRMFWESVEGNVSYILPELLQNINDCSPHNAGRALHVSMEENKLILEYDEDGFAYKNVDAITGIGESTKSGEDEGEKGIGFKRIFSVFEEVHIFSNGFFFKLTANDPNPTVPQWIGGHKTDHAYHVPGKTRMVFLACAENGEASDKTENALEQIAGQWDALTGGGDADADAEAKLLPLFLQHIGTITFRDNIYKRDEMLEHYFRRGVKVFDQNDLTQLYGAECKRGSLKNYQEDVWNRKKCRYFTEQEKKQYFKNLKLEIMLPKPDENGNIPACHEGRGRFYSTLPIKMQTCSMVYINMPFDLTVDRDKFFKLDENRYNRVLWHRIFIDCNGNELPVFHKLLERLAQDEKLFLPDYLCPACTAADGGLFQIFEKNTDEEQRLIRDAFCRIRIFQSFSSEAFCSLVEGYCVPLILYRYLYETARSEKEIKENGRRLHAFTTKRMPELEHYSLIDLPQIDSPEAFDQKWNALAVFVREAVRQNDEQKSRFSAVEQQGDQDASGSEALQLILDYLTEEYASASEQDRMYDDTSLRDRFTVSVLLPFMIGLLRDRDLDDEAESKILSMQIFPYHDRDGIKFGNMNEDGVFWYYAEEKSNVPESFDPRHRVFADSVIGGAAWDEAEDFFKRNYLDEYSVQCMVSHVIDEMRRESSYSVKWWNRAGEILRLMPGLASKQSERNYTICFENARAGICEDQENGGKAFLFPGTAAHQADAGETLRSRLTERGILIDLGPEGTVYEGQKAFWADAEALGMEADAVQLLECMGIASSFADGDDITRALEPLWAELEYPVDREKAPDAYARCEMIEEIMNMQPDAWQQDVFRNRMVVKNVYEQYVPLKWELFYGERRDPFGNKDYQTDQPGLMVRSHAEQKIANKLLEAGIPFVYEKQLGPYCPDFTIIMPDGEAYYWEHFGMMHDAAYRWAAEEKMTWYEEEHKGKLLMTSQGYGEPFNNAVIDQMIDRIKSLKKDGQDWETYDIVNARVRKNPRAAAVEKFERYHLLEMPDRAAKIKSLHSLSDSRLVDEIDFEVIKAQAEDGEAGSELEFHQWMWTYSHEYALAQEILTALSKEISEDADLDINGLRRCDVLDQFHVVLAHSGLSNDGISLELISNIWGLIEPAAGGLTKVEITAELQSGFISQTDPERYKDALTRLDHIYCGESESVKAKYVKCFIDADGEKKDALFLNVRQDDVQEIAELLNQYLRKEVHGAEIEYDWKEAYDELIRELLVLIGSGNENSDPDPEKNEYFDPFTRKEMVLDRLKAIINNKS